MRLLVTGSSGFIGLNLLKKIENIFDVFPCSNTKNLHENPNTKIDFQDIHDVERKILQIEPTHIIHLANSNMKAIHPDERMDIGQQDLNMHFNVFNAAFRMKNPPRVIFLGSCEEYGYGQAPYLETQECDPRSDYGKIKYAASLKLFELAEKNKSMAIILRPSVVYGPGQNSEMLIPSVISSLVRKENLLTTNGTQSRDFIYIDDLVDAIVRSINLPVSLESQIINIAKGESVSVARVLSVIVEIMGEEFRPFIKLGALQHNQYEVGDYRVSNAKSLSVLNWQPKTDLEIGLARTIDWWKEKLGNGDLT
jgi:nucleoside-diphosphate-sugar epimerase